MLPDGAVQDAQGLGCLCTLIEHTLERETWTQPWRWPRLPPTRCYASLGGPTWRQWTMMEEEEGGTAGKVKVQSKWRFTVRIVKPKMGSRESCGLLFPRSAEVTTDRLHSGLSTNLSGDLRTGKGAFWPSMPTTHVSGSPSLLCRV